MPAWRRRPAWSCRHRAEPAAGPSPHVAARSRRNGGDPNRARFRIDMWVLSRVGSAADDAEIGRALAAADVDALALLYDRYGAIAYSVAVRVLGDPGLAEDIVQESFLKLWNSASSFDANRGSLRSWLLTSVRNRAIDQLRGRSGHERREID